MNAVCAANMITVMAYVVMAYIVMAYKSWPIQLHTRLHASP